MTHEQPDPRTTLVAAGLRRDVVKVSGPEALEFLQGQLSQDVTALATGASASSLLLQPTGKVDAWLRATRLADEEMLLDVEVGYGTLVETRLRRFKLRTKVDFETTTWSGLALRGPGASTVEPPAGTRALAAGWPGIEGVDLLGDGELALAGVALVGDDVLDGLRIECGVPAMGAEITEATIPAEAGQWLIDSSVSFTKGCYTGQETVARLFYKGRPNRHLRGLVLGGPAATGDPVIAGEREVGRLGSVVSSPRFGDIALALLRREVEPGDEVSAGGAPARVTDLPFA